MLRNNKYIKFNNNYSTNIDLEKKGINLEKIKYDISATRNMINEYKKFTQSKLMNSDIKLNKTNSLYRNNILNTKLKESHQNLSNNKLLKDKRINDNNIKNNISNIPNDLSDKNNINDESDHSSMETIKKILYSTDSKRDVKKENRLNLLRSTQLNVQPNLRDIFNYKTIYNKKEQKNVTHTPIQVHNNKIGFNYLKKLNIPNTNIFNKINKKLNLNNNNREALNSMKSLKTNNNYDFDNKDNTMNIIDEFNNIIEEKSDLNSNNNKFLNKDNKFSIRTNQNNLNININNNNTDKKNINLYDNKISNIYYSSRYNNEIKNGFLYDLDSNNNDNNIIDDNNNDIDDTNDIFSLKEKIKDLTNEIKNKNKLINEYSNLARKSKIKFEQLIINNKKHIEEIKKQTKKQNMFYKSKIINIEKEKKNLLNKYLENKKYIGFLENILYENINLNNSGNFDESNKVKNLEQIIKKLMNDISNMKIELKNKNKDNQKLKNILIKYKNSKNYRNISNPRKNASSLTIEQIKNMQLSKFKNEINIQNREIPTKNLSKTKLTFHKIFKSNI